MLTTPLPSSFKTHLTITALWERFGANPNIIPQKMATIQQNGPINNYKYFFTIHDCPLQGNGADRLPLISVIVTPVDRYCGRIIDVIKDELT